jgi:hypothetical protein
MRCQFDKIYFVGVIARGARIEMLITLVGEERQQGQDIFHAHLWFHAGV